MASARRPSSTHRPLGTGLRRAASAPLVTALAVAVTLSGCSATNQITTTLPYAASDGIRVEMEDLLFSNLLVLTAGEGEPGTLIGGITNRGDSDTDVSISLEGEAGDPIAVDGGQTVLLSPDHETVDLDQVPAAPGSMVDLTLTSGSGGSRTVRVPVLDGTLPEYTDLVSAAG